MSKKRGISSSTWIVLVILLATGLFLTGCSQNQGETSNQANELTKEEAKTKTLDYVNNNLVMPNTTATAVSVDDKGSVYEVVTKYRGNELPIYLSKNGETLFLKAMNMSDQGKIQGELKAEEAKTRAINYINENLGMPGTNVSAVSVEEKYSVYEVTIEYQGKQQPVYVSKDGKYLFFTALNTSKELPKMTATPAPSTTARETATPPPYSTEELQSFVNCLDKAGVKIYGAKWCPHCQELVNRLGGYDIVDPIYVECTENKQLCQEKGIQAYPTILINGSEYHGPRTYQALSQATGCPVPQS